MTLRAGHVAGGVFVVAGALVVAMSGDLPFGSLAFPGAGFMPRIVAAVLIILGAALALGAAETPVFREVGWGDLGHAGAVVAITAAATALYAWLGFLITLPLLLIALLIFVERQPVWRAALYGIGVTAVTYFIFDHLLHAPVPHGPLDF